MGTLVLTRKVGEAICIGDAKVRILEIRSGQVKLGVLAAPSVEVDREEIRERKRMERAADATRT